MTSDLNEGAVQESEDGSRNARDLSPGAIADDNRRMIDRQIACRRAADIAARALIQFKEVQVVALFGSAAVPLWKEIPRIESYRRNGIALWHECPRVELAIWLDRFHQLPAMRIAVDRALNLDRSPGRRIPLDEFTIAILEHGTDRYVGSLCHFRTCPAGEPACEVAGCGAVGHLR